MKDLNKIEEIYHEALQIPPTERDTFLRESCGDDLELHDEIKSLLSYEELALDFIETPPEDLAAAFISRQNNPDYKGKNFNHYKILEKLGAGGMGEVYLAEDTRLNRKVALKVLPLQFSQDLERRRRFEKEARAVSALNHPNIITIYGIEKADDFNFMVTELVEGVTLRKRLAEKPFSPQEIIEIGIQISDALDSAHSVGIIHRDIKPANIMIRADGIVKVLDFGLAKLAKHGGDSADLETRDHTAPHNIMGTINYMSPEQALGEKVDFRTDIFSLGVVFYEMLAGVKPFDGISDAAIYNATINSNPSSLRELKPEIPLALEQIIFRTIAKKREDRYQTFSELSIDLQKIKENPHANLLAGKFVAGRQKSNLTRFVFPIAAVFLISLIAYFLFFNPFYKPQTSETKNFNYVQLTSQSGEELFPNLSPDGQNLIYASRQSGNWDVYSQQISNLNVVNLTKDSPVDDKQALYSSDGEQIAFRSERDGGGIFVMNKAGENVRKILNTGFYPAWSPNGKEIAFTAADFSDPTDRPVFPSPLWILNLSNSEKRKITDEDAVQPNWSPNNLRIAFWGMNQAGQRDIKTVSVNGGETVAVTNDAAIDWNPVWSADGKYLYFASNRGGSMNFWCVAIDEKSGKILGDPEPFTTPSVFSKHLTFSGDGKSFAYVQTTNSSNIVESAFNPQTEILEPQAVEITHSGRIDRNPSVSPDGEWIAFDAIKDKQEDLFVMKRDGSDLRQLTNDINKDRAPRWSPDGKTLIFYTDRSGKYESWMINTDGSNLRQVSFNSEIYGQIAFWSPDGRKILQNLSQSYPKIFDAGKSFTEQTPFQIPSNTDSNRWIMAMSWSPDNQKIAAMLLGKNNISGIAVYSISDQKLKELTNFGESPIWLNDNRRLIFFDENKVYLLDTITGKYKKLATFGAQEHLQGITISPDNRAIYYSLQKSESDIWLANIQ